MISRPAGHPSQVKQISTPRLSQMGPLYLFSLPKIPNFTRLRAPLTPSIRPALVETHFSDGTCCFHDLCAFSEILEAPSPYARKFRVESTQGLVEEVIVVRTQAIYWRSSLIVRCFHDTSFSFFVRHYSLLDSCLSTKDIMIFVCYYVYT